MQCSNARFVCPMLAGVHDRPPPFDTDCPPFGSVSPMDGDVNVSIVDVTDLIVLDDDRLRKEWTCPTGCMRGVETGSLKRFYHCHGCDTTLEDRDNRDRLGLTLEEGAAVQRDDVRLAVALGIEDPGSDPDPGSGESETVTADSPSTDTDKDDSDTDADSQVRQTSALEW